MHIKCVKLSSFKVCVSEVFNVTLPILCNPEISAYVKLSNISNFRPGITLEVNQGNQLRTSVKSHKLGNPPWLKNPGQMLPGVQNRGISSPTKRTYVLQQFLKNIKDFFGWCSLYGGEAWVVTWYGEMSRCLTGCLAGSPISSASS